MPSLRGLRWLALLLCLLTHEAFALVRIPLQSPRRPSPPHHSTLRRLGYASPHPLAMMQSRDRTHSHDHRHHSDSSRLWSHVRLHNVEDYLYSAQISIGSPPQSFSVLVDTGSTDAWVPGQRCSTCGDHHRHFDRRASHSFADLRVAFTGLYGSGTSQGDVVRDTLAIGEYEIPDFVFALITSETGDIPSFPTDGVLGLAFRGMSKIQNQPTLLDALAKASPSMDAVFAFRLTTDADPRPSELHVGGIDLSVVGSQPRIAYFPVLTLPIDSELTFWTLALESFRVVSGRHQAHGDSRDLCEPFCFAIVDSGSSLIYVPPQHYDAVLALVTEGLECDHSRLQCVDASLDVFPSLSLCFGNGDDHATNTFVLRPESYVSCDSEGNCSINLLKHGEEEDGLFWWVLGDTFLQAFYTVFDVAQRRVGIACDATSSECELPTDE